MPLPDMLSENKTLDILAKDACLSKLGKTNGERYHQRIMESAWNLSSDQVRQALKQAECRYRNGLSVFAVHRAFPYPCPKILFGKLNQPIQGTLTAVFNSRKPRQVLPDDRWLGVLRSYLVELSRSGSGFASSQGTLTYDLVTVHAQKHQSPLLMILPFPLNDEALSIPCSLLLTCQSPAGRCPKSVRMICRDRLLSFIADEHRIVEIRSSGNLFSVLNTQQTHAPRIQRIFIPLQPTPQNRGNIELLERFHPYSKPIFEKKQAEKPSLHGLQQSISCPKLPHVEWSSYLYHYTRSCPGPWAGQSYADYMTSLLENHPLSGHTAIDTLIRILTEGLIRASSRLIRGKHPVISWTSVPPTEMDKIRRWNPALIRWTFEPYGIAILRKRLIQKGCKPVIYGSDQLYETLKPSERFRFQLWRSTQSEWKPEREWRLPGNLLLNDIDSTDGLVFANQMVETYAQLSLNALSKFPVVLF